MTTLDRVTTRDDKARARLERTLRALELRGGEVVELGAREGARYAAMDRHGRELERFDPAAISGLRRSGRLKLRRFERGGVVWALAPGAGARAAYAEGLGGR